MGYIRLADTLTEACTITFPEADFKHAVKLHTNPSGSLYKTFNFSVIMKFGGPELKAQLAWQGAVRYISIFYCHNPEHIADSCSVVNGGEYLS